MGNLFGKKKQTRVTDHDKAVLQVKQQRDKLKQYQKRIELKLEDERNLAKKLVLEGKKERAKLLLRKKKYQEQLLDRTDGQLENLERMIHDLEFSQIETQVLDGLKVGNEALKKVNEVLNVEEVERILEETREGVEKQKELNDLLSGVLTSEDEDAVEAEFAEMMALEEASGDQEVEKDIELPDVPTVEPAVRGMMAENGIEVYDNVMVNENDNKSRKSRRRLAERIAIDSEPKKKKERIAVAAD